MKKYISLLLLFTFMGWNSLSFAAVYQDNQQTKQNYYDKYVKQSQAESNTIKYSKEDEIFLNSDAFENRYQKFEEDYIEQYYDLSAIEKIFNGKDAEKTENPLMQIGYDIFSTTSTSGSTGKYGNSYKLNVGEKVNINLSGDSVDIMGISGSTVLNPNTVGQVDSKGMLFVQGIGSVQAEHKTIGQVESSLNALAAQKYKNTKVKLSVAGGQDFTVFVYGQVNKPGRVLVGNNASIIDALSAAGGVKKTGSLRKITYTTNGKKSKVDLYQAIFQGNDNNIILKANDKIFVGDIGSVVAIKNGVTTPGIYEIVEGDTISKLAQSYAGGFLPVTKGAEVTLTEYDANKGAFVAKGISWNNIKTTKLHNGDTIQFKETYNTVENIVTIQGNIKHPTTYAYREGMHLSDILKSEKELLEESFLGQAVIRRITGDNNEIETIPVYLKDFFAGKSDPLLQPKDIITIYKNTNSDFVDVYGCVNMPKHLTYQKGMTLKNVMSGIQFIETANETGEKEVVFETNEDGSMLVGATTDTNRIIPTEEVAVEITDKSGKTTLYYLYDIMINSDDIKNIELNPNDKIFFRTLRNNEERKYVKISGFVNKPGVYKFVAGKRLTDMIELAGGLTEDADLRGIVYKRSTVRAKQVELATKNNERDIKLVEGRMASQYGATEGSSKARLDMIEQLKMEQTNIEKKYDGQIALSIKSNDLEKLKDVDNIYVNDGDDIYIPRMPAHVNVIGEVYNEMAFVYKKGYNARKYVKEVGGFTPNANRFKLYRISVNGRAERIRKGSHIDPGDTIVVPRKVAGNEWIEPVCKALTALGSVALAVAAVVSIKK